MASPLVSLRVYATLTISLVGVSGYAMQAIATMKERPDLLSESLHLFPRLYYTYHLLFRSFSLRSRVHEPHGPTTRGPCLARLDPKQCFHDVLQSLRPHNRHRCHCSLPVHPQRVRENLLLQRHHRRRRPPGTRLPIRLPHYTLPQAQRQICPSRCQVTPWGFSNLAQWCLGLCRSQDL